jgi:hypothetical protein
LCAFEDNEVLLRIQTKVTRRNDDDFWNPVLLPSDHKITSTLIMEEHVRGSHAVVEILLSTLREHFWISKGRKIIRRVLSKYIHCHRYEAQNIRTKSADLPEDRVRDASVCKVLGIDLVGTFYLKDNRQSWVVIFTCLRGSSSWTGYILVYIRVYPNIQKICIQKR